MSPTQPAPVLATLQQIVPGLDLSTSAFSGEIAREAMLVSRPKGTVLFDEGRACGGMLLLVSGLIRVSRLSPGGRELTLYRVSPQEACVLSLSCALADSEYPARGVVERDILGVMLPRALFERMVDGLPVFRQYVFRALASRVSELIDLSSSVTFEHLDSRLAKLLVRRAESVPTGELEVTHQALAAELGTVRERVSRLLESFELAGLVSLARGYVRVVDSAGLERMAISTG